MREHIVARIAPEPVVARALAAMLLRGAVNGTIYPFGTILLIRNGLPPALVGPLAALAALVTLFSAPTWGRLGDLHGRRRLLVLAFLLASPVAFAHAAPSLPVLAVAYLLWSAIATSFIPLTDSLVMTRLGGSRSRFARVRVGASFAYLAMTVIVGGLITVTALGWAVPGLIGGIGCLAGAGLVAARLRGELKTGTGVGSATGVGMLEGLRMGVRRHWAFLLGLAMVMAAANAPGLFTGPRVAEVGGSAWEIGLATAAGSIIELPAFLVVPALLPLVGGRRLFFVGAILLGVAGFASAVAPTPSLLILARLLFGAGFAWVVITTLGAIMNAATPAEHAAAAALHFAASSAGTLLVAALGLPLVGPTGSVAAVLAAAALAAPIGALVALAAWPKPLKA